MSLLNRVIHELDEQNASVAFYENEFEDIKNNIKTLLNTNLDDCIILNDFGIGNFATMNFNSSELCSLMAKEICKLVAKYEKRIQITSITYDNSLGPWQLSFLLGCVLLNDDFQQSLSIQIVFKSNRYCEVV
ncbi:type VI secretion system baseplate subunit TssE [Campylobacter helveticus]|uniref:Type VI secretion system baseplate subunit TssE n=1 Tax=Campylobacter helveticus TaxID=28898 RepID=A0AAX2UI75_9BACT|nr:type VI secretion system baseplate subunit TssE [Campylobacter helveticus]ARE80317.1 type VI secretion system, baseplate protein [Campylobacter helveticus]MCR2040251.1 type VI secretion system baseplate subunit TssE [Campylobacter helveticus]MCR2055462.1 type VI secretion system baseplate subunit TssE [Campylobacter helveticus]MCR2062925.1 type VI secretion system baseplate subunit TssE [Campylobacter helveticus]MCR2065034.1 type VI secretion system baseplate subunit TssE [Campylobacter hel